MNIASAILHLFPGKSPLKDFEIRDDSDGKGPYIAEWNLEEPQPTEEELQAAWEAYLEAEANKPPELTEMEKLQKENALLKAQITAQSERSDFIEDVIAELATQLYK
ncbi:hypothetical protein GCM10010912_59210 [Paenibacillus albidus]|uniref:Bacteriophage SP-beta YorD domain-containing protein n=1 Tax=Paenibacillus albidus TaxID=2041023 RepID=A0A917D1U6_9BACL|nr:XkdW family protein [Paenibacillus albidus]GGG06710.1 hypothetical protein GCM10010912_59210 [Paenibacillus albidus]